MPRKNATTKTPVTSYDEHELLERERKALAEARKQLTKEYRLLRQQQFRALPRDGRIKRGEVWTIDEFSATLGYADNRTPLKKLAERGVLIDDWGDGKGLIVTDLAIDQIKEHLQCQDEKETE